MRFRMILPNAITVGIFVPACRGENRQQAAILQSCKLPLAGKIFHGSHLHTAYVNRMFFLGAVAVMASALA